MKDWNTTILNLFWFQILGRVGHLAYPLFGFRGIIIDHQIPSMDERHGCSLEYLFRCLETKIGQHLNPSSTIWRVYYPPPGSHPESMSWQCQSAYHASESRKNLGANKVRPRPSTHPLIHLLHLKGSGFTLSLSNIFFCHQAKKRGHPKLAKAQLWVARQHPRRPNKPRHHCFNSSSVLQSLAL